MFASVEEVRRIKEAPSSQMEFPLFYGDPINYQKQGAELAYAQKRLLLMDPTGLGKTVQAILLASKIIEDFKKGKRKTARILIAVESPHVYQWLGEIKRFLNIDAIVPMGEKKARAKKYDNIATRDVVVVLVNHSKLFVDFDMIASRLRPDLFVVDEATILSNKNKTHTYSTWIAKRTEFVLLMTAEPITRGDLLQIRNCMLAMGIELMKSEDEFSDKFVVFEQTQIWARGREGPFRKTIYKPVGAKNLPEFKDLIYPYAIRRPVSILGTKRILNRQLVTVEMTKVMRERYREIERKIKTAKGTHTELNPISTALYLSQCLGSPKIIDEDAPAECPKGEALARLCKKIAPEKIVVFSKWKKMHAILRDVFEAEGVNGFFYSGDLSMEQRNEGLRRFKEDLELQVLVITEAGQKGLNLQFTNNIALLDLLHSPAAVRQLLGRVDRYGQLKNIINFYLFVAEDSTEMNILRVLKDRQAIIDGVFDENSAAIFKEDFTPEELLLDVAN